MNEITQYDAYGARDIGILTFLNKAGDDRYQTGKPVVIYPWPAYGQQGTAVVVISASAAKELPKTGGKDTRQGLKALFDWIESQPAVPTLDLDAMDRGEIY